MLTLRQNLRALPRPVWILFAGTFINRFGTFVMPFLAIYMTRQGYSPMQAGFAVSAYGAGHTLASMIGGHLADRIGRRHTIALSMYLSAIAMVALAQAHTLPMLLALSCVAGIVTEMYRPAATALIGDLVAPEQRIAAFGMYRFAINLGFACGPIIAGFLADRSFVYVFLGDAATSVVFGTVALLALPHGLRSKASEEKGAEGLRYALGDRAFMIFLAATLCITWVEFQLHSTYPVHISRLGYSPATYGTLLSINGVMIVLFELALTSWTQRKPMRALIALGYALAGIGVALTGLAVSVPALAATVVVWTLGEMIYAPVTATYVTSLAPERYRGRYMGLWHFTWSAGMLVGPTLGSMIYERSSPALWFTCALLGITGASLSLVRLPSRLALSARSAETPSPAS
ncbi:MAG TPA: MFS transporter [Thermoanaerobaculia bacterium]|nr:MFS transporter [Thermoanaerobaculia bacterium]